MKKIAVVTNYKDVAEYHKSVLEMLFRDEILVTTYSFDLDIISQKIDADVVLISLYSIYVEIKRFIREDAKIIILGTTITEEQFQMVNQISKTSQVMLVNYSPEMTLETLALFRQIGLTEYDFIPFYPGKKNIPEADIAVTPGEPDKVPPHVKTVVDIGHRTLDMQTITDLAVKIGREDLLHNHQFEKHFKSLKNASSTVSVLLDRANIIESQFLKLLNVIDEGIIGTDIDGVIFTVNDKAFEILKLNSKNIGMNIMDLVKHPFITKAIQEKDTLDYELIQINNDYISFKAVPVKSGGTVTSILFIVNKFDEKEKNQHKLRTQILGKGHKAKYTFDDILGECQLIENTRNMAKRMARSEASVLISGESGTGKELFAQAIHNASKRKEYQFVAINCAAIPENLLESELFGYEEGAFTGAKKGGKMGLFELAHKGTLFLDEIGELPVQLQSRLLRVIQEREVMRIGGDSIIHVDVRIVAATNKNLKKAMTSGEFRADLYYRLNVLSLKTPPLRERGNDVLLIFEHMRTQTGARYTLSEASKNYLLDYKWNGNLRELKNCIDYLAYLEKNLINIEDLKEHLSDDDFEQTVECFQSMDYRIFVLKCLYKSRSELKGIGRRKILNIAKEEHVYITESDIRKILNELSDDGFVTIKTGRGGTFLTEKGVEEAV